MNNSGQGSVILQDSAAVPLQNLKIFGRSTQDGTPSPENPIPIVSAGDNGTIKITLTGENVYSADSIAVEGSQTITFSKIIPAGMYTISSVVESDDTDASYCLLLFYYSDGETKEININRSSAGESKSVVAEFTKPVTRVRVYAGANYSGSVGDSATFTNFKIAQGPQTMNISTPNGLPGIPVDSGGNYTDASGQQWICDEIDFVQSIYIFKGFIKEF